MKVSLLSDTEFGLGGRVFLFGMGSGTGVIDRGDRMKWDAANPNPGPRDERYQQYPGTSIKPGSCIRIIDELIDPLMYRV